MKYLLYCFQVWFLGLVLFAAAACTTESAIQQVLGISAETPVFLACRPVSPREISFLFSRAVRVDSLRFSVPAEIASISSGETVRVNLTEPLEPGARVTADILVADEEGNTLNVLVSFMARNDNMPKLMITEVRTEYSKPRVEFVEFYTLTPGNLGALRLFAEGNGASSPLYEFPPVSVNAGEYIVVHLRSLYEEAVDETGKDLAATPPSKENEALASARDFWIPGAKKQLKKEAGAVYFLNQDDEVLDALLFSGSGGDWPEKMVAVVQFLADKAAWTGTPLSSQGTTATRSLCRREDQRDSNSAGDWYIAASSGSTPGARNNPKVYVPK
ncbi:MAG: hypothetical protein LBT11_01330 [Treponema sp.]|jgi:hypothetical protein|nr:hypothetical protein [Treponema sp.]